MGLTSVTNFFIYNEIKFKLYRLLVMDCSYHFYEYLNLYGKVNGRLRKSDFGTAMPLNVVTLIVGNGCPTKKGRRP